jgi:hypothetical protein
VVGCGVLVGVRVEVGVLGEDLACDGSASVLDEVVVHRDLQPVRGQHRAVHLHGRQAAEFVRDLLLRDGDGLLQGHPLGELRHDRRRRDGRAAAERLELDVGDAVVVDLDRDLHDVTTHRVADLPHAVGVVYHAHVARVVEVFHYLLGVEHGGWSPYRIE